MKIQALADPTRRQIFERLRGGPRTVGEIARNLPVSRPAVSQHLAVLRGAGLVEYQAEGTKRHYGINLEELGELRSYVDSYWDGVLGAFVAAANKVAEKEAKK